MAGASVPHAPCSRMMPNSSGVAMRLVPAASAERRATSGARGGVQRTKSRAHSSVVSGLGPARRIVELSR